MLLKKADFGHSIEEDFVSLISFHKISWLYKPVKFTLNEKAREEKSFEPAFYLPEWDLFVEIATLRKKVATKTNQKIRIMGKLYPHIKIEFVKPANFTKLVENLI